MAYRDELEAARARILRLEEEIAEARAKGGGEGRPRGPVAVVPTLRNKLAKAREAEARVAELEARNAELERGNDPRVAELEARLAEQSRGVEPRVIAAENELAAARATIEQLQRELGGGRLPTIGEHNRRQEIALEGEVAAVACPLCALLGDRVEMILGARWSDRKHPLGRGGRWAICPRCLHEHALA